MALVSVALVTGVIVCLLLPVYALRWGQIPSVGLLVDPNLVVNDSGETSWPPKQLTPPVAYPERITAVGGAPVADNDQFYARLRGYEVGDRVTLTLTQPPPDASVSPSRSAGSQRQIIVPLIRLSSTALWNQFWLVYLVGVLFLITGLLTFIARPEATSAQIFALFTVASAISAGGLFDLTTSQTFARLWILSISLAGSFAAMLAVVFPHETRIIHERPWLKWLVLVPGLLIALWGEWWLYHGPDPWAYAIPWRAAYGLNILTLALSLGTTAYRSIISRSTLVRQQARIILTGGLLAFVPLILVFTVLFFDLEWAWLTQAIYVPPVVLYPLAIGYTIVRYRLLDVDRVLRRGITYLLMIGLLVGAFTLIVSGLSTSLGPGIGFNNPLVVAAVIVIVILLYDPLRTRLQQGVDQYLFRQPVAFDSLLREFNRDLTTAVNTDQVVEMVLRYVEAGIPDAPVCLFIPDVRMACYRCYHHHGREIPPVDMDSALTSLLQNTGGPIDLMEERTWPPALKTAVAEIGLEDAAVLVPIHNGHTLLGWLVLGEAADERPFTIAEINFLDALTDQALIGLERANVVRRLEARITELDTLGRFSQALNFTIELDDLLELIYTNYHRTFEVDAFYIYLLDRETNQTYTAFYLQEGKRYREREGSDRIVTDAAVQNVIETGQMVQDTVDGRTRLLAPLNAGPDTLGVIHALSGEHGFQPRQVQLFTVFADRTAVALDRLFAAQELEVRAHQLEIINEITLSLASTTKLEPLLGLILDKAMALLDTEAGTFMIAHEDTGELEFRVVRGPASEDLLGQRLPVGAGLAGNVAQTGQPSIVNRVEEDERWFAEMDNNTAFETHSILTVPLMRYSTVSGVLQVINKRSGAPFVEEDQQLLMAFAGQAVVAMENARLLAQTDQALQDRVEELFILQQLDRDLNTTLELDRTLDLTLSWALRVCKGTAGTIALVDDEGTVWKSATHGYEEVDAVESLVAQKLTEGIMGRVWHSGKPHVSGNVHMETAYVPATSDTHSQITLPLLNQEEQIGVIAIESNRFDAFSPAMMETAVRITNHAAVSIANAILYQQVKAANEAKSEFVSMVSHELKTPMTSMQGYTDLILSGMTGDLTKQQRRFLEKIMANVNRMQRQIQDLTDISRIETGRLMMVREPTDFANVISETLQTVQRPCDDKEIQLHLDLPSDLPPVMADKERLVQVLTNLISNACKYSPPETKVTLKLETRQMAGFDGEESIEMVVCSVQDQGYGISQTDQEKLFAKFFRADDPNIRKAPGTGLGLSITKGIVELHNGRIWVESEVDRGTTFHFAIPQAPSDKYDIEGY